ncbi:outer membrane protein [Coxiella burnetii]|uniref:outer membrane protein n=1 Tax=Coxiella burnetii TaxID=777 RepID=UPI00051F19E5|nr:outer membrane beta-barrel protein [Coxiella burnetii]AIT62806.1 Outer membrane protein P1 [Coxiella burnetii str. Namibia]
METTTKLAIGVSALCCLASAAFAGGPDIPMIDMNGFHIGLGFGYKSYTYDQVGTVTVTTYRGTILSVLHPVSASITQFGPVGELGYTFASDWWIAGVKAQYQYDNVRSVHIMDASLVGSTYRTRLGSHLTAMLLAGIKVNEANAVYLEAGYSTVWGKTTLFGPGPVAVSMKNRLNGGIAGIGWRHYFMNNVFLDLSYDYALYRSKSNSVSSATASAEGAAIGVLVTVQNPKRVAINGITATVNYLFNI